jgi:hypothetical protein
MDLVRLSGGLLVKKPEHHFGRLARITLDPTDN